MELRGILIATCVVILLLLFAGLTIGGFEMKKKPDTLFGKKNPNSEGIEIEIKDALTQDGNYYILDNPDLDFNFKKLPEKTSKIKVIVGPASSNAPDSNKVYRENILDSTEKRYMWTVRVAGTSFLNITAMDKNDNALGQLRITFISLRYHENEQMTK
jgi:hypothetical protein